MEDPASGAGVRPVRGRRLQWHLAVVESSSGAVVAIYAGNRWSSRSQARWRQAL
jgi:hypothetical protein